MKALLTKLYRPISVFFALALLFAAVVIGADSNNSGDKMVVAADKFIKALSSEQRTKGVFGFDSPERINWHFVPLQDKQKNPTRKGLRFEEMTGEQKELAFGLLRSATSEAGFDKAKTIMSLEGVLKESEKNGVNVRSPEWYFVSIFGDPNSGKPWGWRFEGHHLSLNFTLDGKRVVSTTPAFFGANPAIVKAGAKKGLRTLPEAEEAPKKLIAALDENQKKEARKDKIFAEIEQEKALAPDFPKGISVAKLTSEQKTFVKDILSGYANRLAKDLAEKELARLYGEDFASLDFSYAEEENKPGHPLTYRLQGKNVLIEFLNIQADGSGNPANHIHSSWRASTGDFGQKKK